MSCSFGNVSRGNISSAILLHNFASDGNYTWIGLIRTSDTNLRAGINVACAKRKDPMHFPSARLHWRCHTSALPLKEGCRFSREVFAVATGYGTHFRNSEFAVSKSMCNNCAASCPNVWIADLTCTFSFCPAHSTIPGFSKCGPTAPLGDFHLIVHQRLWPYLYEFWSRDFG